MAELTCIELFAGAGGASLGLHNAGFKSMLAAEWDPHACETHRQGLPGVPVFEGDVREIDLSTIPEAPTLMWASPPCQPFSSAGNRKGSADERNGWPWTTDLIDAMEKVGKKPVWVICENVPGMVHHRGGCPRDETTDIYKCSGCYWERWIIPEFEKRYPHVSHAKLNSADYGVAQRRDRIFLVAGPVPFEWPEPSHSFLNLVYEKWVTDEYWTRTGVSKPDKIHSKAERKLESNVTFRFAKEAPDPGRKAWVTIREALGLGYPVRHQSPSAPAIQHGPDAPSSTVSVKGTLYAEKDIQDDPAYNPYYDKKVIGGGTNPHGKKKEHERTFRDLTDEPSTTITCEDNYGNRGPWMVDVPKGAQSVSPDEPSTTIRAGGNVDASGKLGGGSPPYLDMNEEGEESEEPMDFFDFLDPDPPEKRKIGKWVVQHEDKEPGERPDLLDGTFRTVSATEYKGASSWGKVNRASDDLIRATGRKRLTVEECAILQGFPEDWPFQGTSTAQYRQVGNAVPPHVAEALARQVKKLTE